MARRGEVGVSDMNCLSVINYGVEHLHVKHVLVVGHYDCGGVRAAMANRSARPRALDGTYRLPLLSTV